MEITIAYSKREKKIWNKPKLYRQSLFNTDYHVGASSDGVSGSQPFS